MRKIHFFLLLSCLGNLGFFPKLAAGFPPPTLDAQSSQGISYISGGIGEQEREVLQQLGRAYTLKLIFAQKEGNYLSDVKLTIRDQSGRNILEEMVEGPWFFADLPPGRYDISAMNQGVVRTQNVYLTIGEQRQLAFYW